MNCNIVTICKRKIYALNKRQPKEDSVLYLADSCFARKIVENPNYLTALALRNDFSNSKILLCDQVCYELVSHGFSLDEVTATITKVLRSKVVLVQATIPEYVLAESLVEQFTPKLHWPDNLILSAAIQNKSILLSCDKDLIEVSEKCGQKCINPDLIGTWEEILV